MIKTRAVCIGNTFPCIWQHSPEELPAKRSAPFSGSNGKRSFFCAAEACRLLPPRTTRSMTLQWAYAILQGPAHPCQADKYRKFCRHVWLTCRHEEGTSRGLEEWRTGLRRTSPQILPDTQAMCPARGTERSARIAALPSWDDFFACFRAAPATRKGTALAAPGD